MPRNWLDPFADFTTPRQTGVEAWKERWERDRRRSMLLTFLMLGTATGAGIGAGLAAKLAALPAAVGVALLGAGLGRLGGVFVGVSSNMREAKTLYLPAWLAVFQIGGILIGSAAGAFLGLQWAAGDGELLPSLVGLLVGEMLCGILALALWIRWQKREWARGVREQIQVAIVHNDIPTPPDSP